MFTVLDRAAYRRARDEQREEGEALLATLRADIAAAEEQIAHIVCKLADRIDGYRVDSGRIHVMQQRRAMLEIRDALNDMAHEAREHLDDYADAVGSYQP